MKAPAPSRVLLSKKLMLTFLIGFIASIFIFVVGFHVVVPDDRRLPIPAYFHEAGAIPNAKLKASNFKLDPLKPYGEWSEKWIVVTTISKPSKDIKYLASLPGWRVVVVGDVKTPADWSYPNCDFLNISMQENIGYHTAEVLPHKIYGRKIIGYLHAILHGAKIIYETDDDNRPLDGLTGFDLGDKFTGINYAGPGLFNPYHHFGQSTLWPRGYPLSAIGQEMNRLYRIPKQTKAPFIQQGIVNGDPDMDAIFRLTRKKIVRPLDIKFDPAAPAVLVPAGTYSPFNSQNTLFRREAFWALLLPTATTMRVCDIWRSYWAQRLLWEIDGRLAFYPSNAYQQRNGHDYIKDAIEELDLYTDTEKLVHFLRKWVCPQEKSFFGCVERLTMDLALADLWPMSDVQVAQAWLADLRRVGYQEPARTKNAQISFKPLKLSTLKTVRNKQECYKHFNETRFFPPKSDMFFVFYPAEQDPPPFQRNVSPKLPKALRHATMIAKRCPNPEDFLQLSHSAMKNSGTDFFKDILVIISFHYHHYYRNIQFHEALYRNVFPNMVYCGPGRNTFVKVAKTVPGLREVSYIEADVSCGYLVYSCVLEAIRAGYKVSGYLHLSDDIFVNPWSLIGFNKSRPWLNYQTFAPLNENLKWPWWNMFMGMAGFQKVRETAAISNPPAGVKPWKDVISDLEKTAGGKNNVFHGLVDIHYIPSNLKLDVEWYYPIFYNHTVFLEIAVPSLLVGLAPKFDRLIGKSGWKGERHRMWDYFSNTTNFMHPIKFSHFSGGRDVCKKLLTRYFRNLYPAQKAPKSPVTPPTNIKKAQSPVTPTTKNKTTQPLKIKRASKPK